MKIAFLTPLVPPVIDGVGEYSFHLVKTLRLYGDDARLFTSRGQKQAEEWVSPVIDAWDGVHVVKALRDFQPDICFFQYVPQLYGKYGICWSASAIPAAIKKNIKCRVGITFHEFAPVWEFSFKNIVLGSVTRMQARRMTKASDIAIATCEIYREIINAYSPKLIMETIPVGANVLPVTLSPEELTALRQKNGLIDKKVLTFFGRISNFKNPRLAIRVLKEAAAKGIAAVLVFVGCGRSSQPELFDEMMRYAKALAVDSRIIETGDLCPEEISAWLQISDLFLFPQMDGISSRNTTVMSAMAHGLPIVAYEPITGNFEGYSMPSGALVRRGNENEFIEAAIEWARSAMGESKKLTQMHYFAENFSWEKIALMYREIIASA